VNEFFLQKLARTSPTSGDRSVGIVRSRTQATEFLSNHEKYFKRVEFEFLSVVINLIVHWKSTDVSEEYDTSIFSAEECSRQESSVKLVAGKYELLSLLLKGTQTRHFPLLSSCRIVENFVLVMVSEKSGTNENSIRYVRAEFVQHVGIISSATACSILPKVTIISDFNTLQLPSEVPKMQSSGGRGQVIMMANRLTRGNMVPDFSDT
jgi:hypothetical protein